MLHKCIVVGLLVGGVMGGGLWAKKEKKQEDVYRFKDELRLPVTEVKSQGRTGTCWNFATMSFLESEVLRKNGKSVNLSEMFVVNHAYRRKALNYVMRHGSANFSEGGQAHDVVAVMADQGLVPEDAYPGIIPGYSIHNHAELGGVLKGMLDAVVGRKGGRLSNVWEQALAGVLNQYLGNLPESFNVEGKSYTPRTYVREYLELDPADYVEITSYSHHP